MFRRWLIVTLTCAFAFATAALGISIIRDNRPPTHKIQPGGLIVMAMPGLTWSDINAETTPTLWRMAHQGAVGNQLVRVISAHSCSNAAWVTLGSGTRTPLGYSPMQAPASGVNDYCPELITGQENLEKGTYTFPYWAKWSRDALHRNLPSRMGLVASKLHASGQCVAAVGPGAALGAADESGTVSHYYPTIRAADFSRCPVTFVSSRTRADANLAYVVAHAPKDTTFLITGLSDDERPESPRAVILDGPRVGNGLLRSRSTRQPGLVQTTDLSAFILARTQHPPILGEGRTLTVERQNAKASLESVTHHSQLLRTEHNLVGPFFLRFGIATAFALAIGVVWWTTSREGERARRNARTWLSWSTAILAAMPASTFLANLISWYQHDHALVWLLGSVFGFCIPLAAAALLGPWRRWVQGPAVFLAAATALTLAMDAVQGSPLQLDSILGLQPVYGGRFYGMGNVGFAVFMAAVLWVAAMMAGRYRALKRPRLAMITVLAIGIPTVLVEGVPQWGNDGGGSAAFLPALLYLVMRARGIRITLVRLGIAGLSGLALVFVLGWLDWLRGPTRRTHLGEIFAGLINSGEMNPFKRVIIANWTMLNMHWINWGVPVMLVFAAAATAFPMSVGRFLQPLFVRIPMMRHGLIAIVILLSVGFIANDSGTSVPPSGLLLIVPLLLLTAVRLSAPGVSAAPRNSKIPA